jgi:hypothetical protein
MENAILYLSFQHRNVTKCGVLHTVVNFGVGQRTVKSVAMKKGNKVCHLIFVFQSAKGVMKCENYAVLYNWLLTVVKSGIGQRMVKSVAMKGCVKEEFK